MLNALTFKSCLTHKKGILRIKVYAATNFRFRIAKGLHLTTRAEPMAIQK